MLILFNYISQISVKIIALKLCYLSFKGKGIVVWVCSHLCDQTMLKYKGLEYPRPSGISEGGQKIL